MNTKTIGGLVGASTSVDLMNTPVRVFDEARHKGDTATMERAMGYAGECADKAKQYKTEADQGMKEDAKEVKEKEKLLREEIIRKRKEEREKQEDRIEGNKNADARTDTVEISEEGKAVSEVNTNTDSTGSDEIKTEDGTEPVTYTKTGDVVLAQQDGSISVSV